VNTTGPKDVDGYIAAAPKAVQPKLRRLRALIKAAAPKAEEKISYGMPYYGYKGRLVYFAVFEKHIGLYAAWPAKSTYAKEIERYKVSKGTLRFPIGDPLPAALITKIVKARGKENDARG
jgi:uncharacterized protein YdhG (YjbR/CyaY superfamily)